MKRDGWLGIELRHFAALAAVADERSFRRAAARLGYVQSAISRQIAYLEQLTGSRLIERSQGPKPVQLTPEGRVLLAHASDILAAIDAAKADLGRMRDARRGEVRVGVFPGVPTRLLPRALRVFAERRPEVRVTAREALDERPLLELLRAGRLDLAFVHLPLEHAFFAAREVLRISWALIVPADWDMARRETPPTPAEIARLPLVARGSSRAQAAVESRLKAEGERTDIVLRLDVPDTVQALVASGIGAAVLPRLTVRDDDPNIAVIELGDEFPPAALGLAWVQDREPADAVRDFRELIAELAPTLPALRRGMRFARGPEPRTLADAVDR
jgi:DNA-binding transcriptional LysR family regulator